MILCVQMCPTTMPKVWGVGVWRSRGCWLGGVGVWRLKGWGLGGVGVWRSREWGLGGGGGGGSAEVEGVGVEGGGDECGLPSTVGKRLRLSAIGAMADEPVQSWR